MGERAVKRAMPTSLRRPDQRLAARKMADALLRADARRRRISAMPPLAPKKPAPTSEMKEPQRLHLSDLKLALSARRRSNNTAANADTSLSGAVNSTSARTGVTRG
jgi:hypothetical protein